MNPIFKAAAQSTELGWLMGGVAAFFLLFFMAWVIWVLLPRNQRLMREAAAYPLDDSPPFSPGDRP